MKKQEIREINADQKVLQALEDPTMGGGCVTPCNIELVQGTSQPGTVFLQSKMVRTCL
jgi:hypothetical protein